MQCSGQRNKCDMKEKGVRCQQAATCLQNSGPQGKEGSSQAAREAGKRCQAQAAYGMVCVVGGAVVAEKRQWAHRCAVEECLGRRRRKVPVQMYLLEGIWLQE